MSEENDSAETESPSTVQVLAYDNPTEGVGIAQIWCRIFALWLLAQGLGTLLSYLGYIVIDLFQSGTRSGPSGLTAVWALSSIIQPLSYIWFAWFVWHNAPGISRRITGGVDLKQNSSQRSTELFSTLLVLLGIYIFVEGFTRVVHSSALYWNFTRRQGGSSPSAIEIVPEITRCAIGMWFIFGTRGIAEFIRRHGGKWNNTQLNTELEQQSKS